MPYSSASLLMNSDFEVLWSFLIDKLLHPEHYMGQVRECRIEKISEHTWIRELTTEAMEIKERLEFNWRTKEILLVLLEHPRFTGTVVYRLLPQRVEGTQQVEMTVTLEWRDKSGVLGDLQDSYGELLLTGLQRIQGALES